MKCVWRPFVVIAVIAAVALVVPLTATAGATVKTSGFVLVNAAFNTGNPANPDIPTAARADGDAAESFLITPRQSRLTLTMADEESYWTPTGKMEMDFWGLHSASGPGGVTQAAPRLRLAYVELKPSADAKITVGQQWIVFAPLSPSSIAHVSIPMNNGAGNLWARLPMIRLDLAMDSVDLAVSVNRPHGADVSKSPTQADQLGAGELSRLPIAQARLGVKSGKLAAGASGHFGSLDFRGDTDTVTSYAAAVDLKLALDKITVSGEGFIAENVGTLFSGIKATASDDGVITERKGMGGWGQVSLAATKTVTLNVGGGVEIREVKDVDGDTMNLQTFANVMCSPSKPLTFALEGVLTQTDNPTAEDADNTEQNISLNLGVRYKF